MNNHKNLETHILHSVPRTKSCLSKGQIKRFARRIEKAEYLQVGTRDRFSRESNKCWFNQNSGNPNKVEFTAGAQQGEIDLRTGSTTTVKKPVQKLIQNEVFRYSYGGREVSIRWDFDNSRGDYAKPTQIKVSSKGNSTVVDIIYSFLGKAEFFKDELYFSTSSGLFRKLTVSTSELTEIENSHMVRFAKPMKKNEVFYIKKVSDNAYQTGNHMFYRNGVGITTLTFRDKVCCTGLAASDSHFLLGIKTTWPGKQKCTSFTSLNLFTRQGKMLRGGGGGAIIDLSIDSIFSLPSRNSSLFAVIFLGLRVDFFTVMKKQLVSLAQCNQAVCSSYTHKSPLFSSGNHHGLLIARENAIFLLKFSC